MTVSPTDKKIAIIAANGFDESHMTAVQRAMTQAQLTYKIIAPEQGLVNGWQDKGWGHYFPVDAPISTALGSDYDILILVGGERGIAKLKQNPHVRRIVNHFVEAEKPIAAIGDGVALLALSPAMSGKTVTAPDSAEADLVQANIMIAETDIETNGPILTATGDDLEAWTDATLTLINTCEVLMDEAA